MSFLLIDDGVFITFGGDEDEEDGNGKGSGSNKADLKEFGETFVPLLFSSSVFSTNSSFFFEDVDLDVDLDVDRDVVNFLGVSDGEDSADGDDVDFGDDSGNVGKGFTKVPSAFTFVGSLAVIVAL